VYAIHYSLDEQTVISDDDALDDDHTPPPPGNDDDEDDEDDDTPGAKGNESDGDVPLSAGSISGIVIGSLVFCILVIFLCYLLLKTDFLITYGCKKKPKNKISRG
jgi:hypothetical protein